MGSIIDLLAKLFNLTKVASVTLPGLVAAGVLCEKKLPATAGRDKAATAVPDSSRR
jgi:hypothetical protein